MGATIHVMIYPGTRGGNNVGTVGGMCEGWNVFVLFFSLFFFCVCVKLTLWHPVNWWTPTANGLRKQFLSSKVMCKITIGKLIWWETMGSVKYWDCFILLSITFWQPPWFVKDLVFRLKLTRKLYLLNGYYTIYTFISTCSQLSLCVQHAKCEQFTPSDQLSLPWN